MAVPNALPWSRPDHWGHGTSRCPRFSVWKGVSEAPSVVVRVGQPATHALAPRWARDPEPRLLSPDRPPEWGLETPAPLCPLGPHFSQDPARSLAGATTPAWRGWNAPWRGSRRGSCLALLGKVPADIFYSKLNFILNLIAKVIQAHCRKCRLYRKAQGKGKLKILRPQHPTSAGACFRRFLGPWLWRHSEPSFVTSFSLALFLTFNPPPASSSLQGFGSAPPHRCSAVDLTHALGSNLGGSFHFIFHC